MEMLKQKGHREMEGLAPVLAPIIKRIEVGRDLVKEMDEKQYLTFKKKYIAISLPDESEAGGLQPSAEEKEKLIRSLVLRKDWVQLQNQDMMKVALSLAELGAYKVASCVWVPCIQEEQS